MGPDIEGRRRRCNMGCWKPTPESHGTEIREKKGINQGDSLLYPDPFSGAACKNVSPDNLDSLALTKGLQQHNLR
jgi:hypothetical protein